MSIIKPFSSYSLPDLYLYPSSSFHTMENLRMEDKETDIVKMELKMGTSLFPKNTKRSIKSGVWST